MYTYLYKKKKKSNWWIKLCFTFCAACDVVYPYIIEIIFVKFLICLAASVGTVVAVKGFVQENECKDDCCQQQHSEPLDVMRALWLYYDNRAAVASVRLGARSTPLQELSSTAPNNLWWPGQQEDWPSVGEDLSMMQVGYYVLNFNISQWNISLFYFFLNKCEMY